MELFIQFVRESRSPRETRWLVLRIRKVVFAEYKSVVNISAGSELRILSADLKFSPFGVEKTFRLERLGILLILIQVLPQPTRIVYPTWSIFIPSTRPHNTNGFLK